MRASDRVRLQQLTDEVVAQEVAAGQFPAGEDLRELQLRIEAALHLADLAGEDPESVFVIGCALELGLHEEPRGYVVRAREERVLLRHDERVSLVVADGVTREQALVRVEHIRTYLQDLPQGTVLVTDDPWLNHKADRVARLQDAREIVLRDIRSGTDEFPF